MPQENKAVLTVVGDFGNPSGSGLSKIVLDNVRNGTALSAGGAEGIAIALHEALIAAGLTATLLSDTALTGKMPNAVGKPAANVNIDRVLVCAFRTVTDSSVRRLTIPGVPVSSPALELTAAGERLNESGKIALAAALGAFYNLAGEIVVLYGKILQKT